MSALFSSDFHISVIACTIADSDFSEYAFDGKQLADKLKQINIESVNYRYKENNPAEPCEYVRAPFGRLTNNDVAKLIQCWVYQSGEKPTIDFVAYAELLNSWIKHTGADADKGRYWSI